MKSFTSIVVFAVIAIVGANNAANDNKQGAMVASSYGGGYSAPAPAAAPSYSAPAPAPASSHGASASSYSAPAATSHGGSVSAYSAPAAPSYSAPLSVGYAAPAVRYPAPPCPRNYLFSCQPSLSPVGCSSPSSSGIGGPGLAAAYSQYVPSYALPPQVGYGY